jgi:hypothetical protein
VLCSDSLVKDNAVSHHVLSAQKHVCTCGCNAMQCNLVASLVGLAATGTGHTFVQFFPYLLVFNPLKSK